MLVFYLFLVLGGVVDIWMGMWMGRDGGRRTGVEAGKTTEESEEEEMIGGVVRAGRLADGGLRGR